MDQRAVLDHQFLVAAYAITWAMQLGYLAWLGFKWKSEKRNAEHRAHRAARVRSAHTVLQPPKTRGTESLELP